MGKVTVDTDAMATAEQDADREAAQAGIAADFPSPPGDPIKPKRTRRTREQMIADGDAPGSGVRGKGTGRGEAALADKLEKELTAMGLAIGMFNGVDSAIIVGNAENVSKAWAKLAMQNPRLKRMLENGLEGSAILGCVVATALMVVPILLNHGLVPAGLAGKLPVPPSVMAQAMAGMANSENGDGQPVAA